MNFFYIHDDQILKCCIFVKLISTYATCESQLDYLHPLKNKFKDLYFLMGADSLINFHKWYKWSKILENCKIYGDRFLKKYYRGKILPAKEKNWSTEYLAPAVSVKTVNNLNEAINHINKYGTMHTDSIITNNKKTAKNFLRNVKSSIAMHNTSTQFADGGEFGFGGEVGISTNILPPRGPVGLNQLVSYKYEITSEGKTRK